MSQLLRPLRSSSATVRHLAVGRFSVAGTDLVLEVLDKYVTAGAPSTLDKHGQCVSLLKGEFDDTTDMLEPMVRSDKNISPQFGDYRTICLLDGDVVVAAAIYNVIEAMDKRGILVGSCVLYFTCYAMLYAICYTPTAAKLACVKREA
jgi:hypothetical protein